MEKLLLIDGNSMLFRAYYATAYGKAMTTTSGIPTNAVFGFASMLKKALEVIGPDKVLVAFDHDKDNFRRQVYPQYKGTRQPTPDALVIQFPIVREYIAAVGITQIEQHGIEADDIIGSLARQHPEYEVSVLTSDKDLLQLVDDRIRVWLMKKGITEMEQMDPQAVYDRFSLRPLQIIDLKGLAGDPSDNIPGVSGVGDKTAIRLLNQYDSVEGVYDHIGEIKGKLQENLVRDHDQALQSKWLATIKTDAEIAVDLSQCGYDFGREDALAFYSKYEMRSLMDQTAVSARSQAPREAAVRRVTSLAGITLASPCAVVLQGDEPEEVALADGTGCWTLSWDDAQKDEAFRQWLAANNEKILYDVKRWYHLLDGTGVPLNGKITDLMIAAFLSDCKIKTLADLLIRYHAELKGDEAVRQTSLFEPDGGTPSGLIAQRLLTIAPQVMAKLSAYGMTELYWRLELPLAEVLFEMERKGVCVDETVLDAIAADTGEKLEQLEQRIYAMAGRPFNINSPKQLAEVLYDDLGLMRSSKRSTDAAVLKKMADRHPIVPLILEYRKYAKLNSTYAVGLKKYIRADHKIHTEFNQCVAETGRLSSSNPNLQNITVRNEETMQIRRAFIPEDGCVFVGADYSQVELRILAHLADEPALIEAFRQGMDIHTKTAMDVFNVSADQVTPLLRRQAKAINFGIDYGMTDFGLADRLGIPVSQAHQFIQDYYARYPNVRRYMEQTVADCEKNGYVSTILNRRREIPEIHSSNRSMKEFGKRAAMNAPVQGSAADLIKVAMLNVRNRLKQEGLKAEIILQIHDELILNVPEAEKEAASRIVQEEMEHAMELKVPLVAETESGANWLEVK